MARIKIVTDSTSDLPDSFLAEHGIEMVPLNVHFGPETYRDRVEISAADFFAKLRTSPHHPKTSQPSPGDFLEAYRRLAGECDTVVSVHVSSKLSGTYQSAAMARDMLRAEGVSLDVELVDTASASMGIGFAALEAARAVRAGAGKDEVARRARDAAARTSVFFGVHTLEFLAKNGRIGKAQALLGGMLNVKPLLTVEDGIVAPAEKVRGWSRMLPRLVEIFQEKVPEGKRAHVAVIHADAAAEAETLRGMVTAARPVDEALIAPVGPVIGVNVGPGTVGLVFYAA